ncbi:MAG: lasso peptide biosynthesis B2 protein [Phenylobacterium sp.]|uniref:lasso peptide biosynthesis B2 protein n=1 Tax=Phenylobacterium sp. TaxID=1871053 RepID=UPI001A2794B2|nr:lasso peptide biosynthesis B2 protein [Phenylobacterium sp.]MBJ7411236.1 lasso peptide biosynthesis B2 protein [Phenylobacterium sp.]
MFATLLPHVHAAVIADDVVLLDVRSDNYFCLPGAAEDLARPVVDDGEDGLAALLVAQGLAQWSPCPMEPPAAAPASMPRTDVLDQPCSGPSLRDAMALIGAYLDTMLHYRAREFAHLTAYVRRGRVGAAEAAGDDAELRRLCAVFAQLVPWVPISGKCLERSFLLLRFLQRRGRDARWVFGVTTWPFAAHCWLQVDEVALDDAAERLVRFTPIMVA